ncbi:MAG: DUF2334 domain-containing protein, partial [Burkholderiales bacterium]
QLLYPEGINLERVWLKLKFSRLWVLASILVCFSASGVYADQLHQICVNFRVDDYSSTSDYESDRRIVELFKKRHTPVTMAVVPFSQGIPLQGERATALREWARESQVEVAQHGYSHASRSEVSAATEFVGLGLDRQFFLIEKGKAHLETVIGRPVTLFVPPWNSYDENTLNVLERLDFEVISASLDGVGRADTKLRFIPFTALLNEYPAAVSAARKLADRGIESAVIVLYHGYELTDGSLVRGGMYGGPSSFSYAQLKELLDWTLRESDLKVCTIKEIAERISTSRSSSYRVQMSQSSHYFETYKGFFSFRNRLLPSNLVRPQRDPLGKVLTYPAGLSENRYWLAVMSSVVAPVFGAYFSVYLLSFLLSDLV